MSNKMSMNERFATENIPKLIVSLATPAILAQVINALYNAVDRMYIARIPDVGTTALTGVGISFPIIMIVSAFASLVGSGGAPRSSIYIGAGKKDRAEQLMGNCFAALVIVSVLLTFSLQVFRDPLLRTFGASDLTLPYASSYLMIYLIGTISVQVSLGMNPFISAQGYAKTAMISVLIGAGLNIILDPIFIFVFNMGVEGAAWATVLSQTVSALWVVVFLTSGKGIIRLRLKNMRIRPEIVLGAVALGISPFIMQSTESLIQVVFNTSLAKYGGDNYVGAMVIMVSLMQFMMLPLQGLAQGAQPIIGYNYGSKNFDRVKTAIKFNTLFCFLFGLVIWCIMVFYPHIPVKFFTNDPAMIELTSSIMPLFFFGTVIFGLQLAFQQIFVALGQAKVSIFIACLRKLFLLIPLILILPHFTATPTFGVFLAEPVADIISALTCTILFIIKYRELLCVPKTFDLQ